MPVCARHGDADKYVAHDPDYIIEGSVHKVIPERLVHRGVHLKEQESLRGVVHASRKPTYNCSVNRRLWGRAKGVSKVSSPE